MISTRLPYKHLWERMLTERMGATRAQQIMARVQMTFDQLFETRGVFSNGAMRDHLERHILPGIALYRALLEQSGDQQHALEEWDVLTRATGRARRRLITLLRFVPVPFTFLRLFTRLLMRYQYPALGWDTEWVADTPERMAFNIHRCIYLETLTAHGVPELTRHFCAVDDWFFEALPQSIIWARTKTLGRGNDRCDFCWLRAET